MTFVKRRTGAPRGFFAAEAYGLRWLAEAGGVAVPAVLSVSDDAIEVERIRTEPPAAAMAEAFGRDLATTHRAGAPSYGLAHHGWIGDAPLDNTPAGTWPRWYAERRLLPYLTSAALAPADHAAVAAVVETIETLAGPAEPPSRIHGDLWNGNVLWSADGRVYVIDPAAHGGHRETDLAMLALFGAPFVDRIVAAYDEAWPLAAGWRSRVALHQLHPLLVHAVLFGGGYRTRAGDAARAALRAR